MLFNSLAYLIFLPVTVCLYWLVPFKWRVPLLLLASYVFYMFWKPVYGLLMIGLTIVNYLFGLLLERTQTRKRLCLALGVIVNLVVLAFFKYTYFLHDSINELLSFVKPSLLPPIPFEIILPLGISFFVFEFIHYLVDVYRGGKAIRSIPEFALFPAFFPTQIAGPIKRYQDFIPQLKAPRKISVEDFNEAVELIIFGLFKKVALADNLAFVVNRCYAHPDLLTGTDLWLATYAFVFQLYFDFSGYTDIARGSALLMGFKVPLNFKLPLLASSVSEFWHRWHISLSTWLRDYLYVPLGGSRHGKWLTYRNLFITMTLGGLWHGSSNHYLAWGAFEGILLVSHKEWRALCQVHQRLSDLVASKLFHWFAIALNFHCWTVAMVFFRAENLKVADTILKKMFGLATAPAGAGIWQPTILNSNTNIMYPLLPFILVLLMAAQIAVSRFKGTTGIMPLFGRLAPLRAAYLAALILVLLVLSPNSTPQFVYFQF